MVVGTSNILEQSRKITMEVEEAKENNYIIIEYYLHYVTNDNVWINIIKLGNEQELTSFKIFNDHAMSALRVFFSLFHSMQTYLILHCI